MARRVVIDRYMSWGMADRDRLMPLKCVPRRYGHDGRLRILSLERLSEMPLRHREPAKARIRFKVTSPGSAVSVRIGFSAGERMRLLTFDTDFQDGFRPDFLERGALSTDLAFDALPLARDIHNVTGGRQSGDFDGLDLAACQLVEVTAGPNTPRTIIRSVPTERQASNWPCEAAQPVRLAQAVA
jgi:hypothetical protein